MINQSNAFEKRARTHVNKLKLEYVIDLVTAERLEEIFVYLYLSQVSRNQRGVNIQTEKLKSILHNCPKIIAPVFSAQSRKAACAA